MRLRIPGLICALGLTVPTLARAEEPQPSDPGPKAANGEATVDASIDTGVQPSTETNEQLSPRRWNRREDQRWIRRWRPEARMVELGAYGGVLLLNSDHELFDPDVSVPIQGWQPMRRLNPDFGARIGYYPFRFVGFEAEGGAMPSKLDDGSPSLPFTVRGHVIAQLGRWSVTPFVLLGGGMLGINSSGPLGTDIDPALHFGGGVKVFINRWVMLRLDVRDVISHQLGVDQVFNAHNLEALLGLSVTLNRQNTQPRPEPRQPPPVEPRDRDGDGLLDPHDQCIDDPETVNGFEDQDGCPEADSDADGFWDPQDSCPEQAGVAPDGCPIGDTDSDGMLDDVDECIEEPETFNGFDDLDGCPDELPDDIKRFTGSINGITFDVNKATIRRSSIGVLDDAVRTLQQYPDVRIEIAGHTDDRGAHDHNMELSRERAKSVKSYLVGMGVDEARIETIGHGPDIPIESNDTKAGRAKNRRIEFTVVGRPAEPAGHTAGHTEAHTED